MSWVTFIWAMLIGLCVAMAFPQLVIWIWRRRVVRLLFVILAVASIALLSNELALMHSSSVEEFATVLQWRAPLLFVMFVTIIGFVRLYFGTGRWWLGITACAVRLACLVINFALPPNLYYREITALRSVYLLGDTVSTPVGVGSPWSHLAELSSLFLLAFVVDASISLWHQGKPESRRRALLIGGSITCYEGLAAALGMLIHLRSMPAVAYFDSLPFVAILAGMAFELSYDLYAALVISRKLQLSEASLQESEVRFRIAADSAPVPIWMSGTDKLCTFFNKSWLDFTGRTMEQEIGNGWAEGVHPDDLQRCRQTYTVAFDAREPFVMEYRLRRRDGEYRWIKDDGVPRYDTQKNFSGYIGSCVDITESTRKEQALRESEERMSLAMDAAKLGLWEWDVSKDQLWGTKARSALLGLPTSGAIKLEDGLSTVHANDRNRVRQTLKDAARTGEDYHLEYRVVLPDGSVQWTDHRGRCVRGTDGKDLILRGISMDVTERKRAEEKFRMAVEASPSGILLVNQTGQIVLVNSQIEQLFGYGREELIGHSVEILVPERFAGAHPEHRAKFFAAPAARAMGAGRELFARRKDGTEFPVEIGLNPIQSPEGALVLAAVVDISARLEAEEEAGRRRQQIELLSRASLLGEMTASLAHELSQPLATIINNASAAMEYIEQDRLDPTQLQEILTDVIADGRRAVDIIRNVRNAIKKGSAIRGRINLNDMVKAVRHMVYPDAAAHLCTLEMSLARDLPSVDGDPTQIQQVLLNLVHNAFDAMGGTPSGQRVVEISTNYNGDGTISVAVRDHGRGISEKTRERLFEQFFTTKEEGLGMGLAIVRSIVEAHGGTIAAENADGGGARFHFRLPASKATPQ
jgi:PAS domain S-box-containing protein